MSLDPLDQGSDHLFGFAAHHIVGVLQRLVGAEGDVHAPEDNRLASRSAQVCQPVGLWCRAGRCGDANDVCRQQVLDPRRTDALTVDGDAVALLLQHGPN